MQAIVIVVGGGGGLFGLAFLFITFFYGATAVEYLTAPLVEVYHEFVYPPMEERQKYLEPCLKEIIKIPYDQIPSKKDTFVINIDGKDIICTYYLDDSWFTGFRKWQAKEDSMIGSESLRLANGIIYDPFLNKHDRDSYGKEIGRKVNVEIRPKNEDDFHPFEMTYAAVTNTDWYDLIPY
ncbi:MAG: hypothetical protein II798_02570, partial [Lachnospiraceae bacterium]|nr:hypothetical protein [Lachnospiraceae bacterium]